MYVYEGTAPDGELVRVEELFILASEAPETLEVDGVTLRRVAFPQGRSHRGVAVKEYKNASRQLPRGFGHWDPKIKHDRAGRVVVEGKADVDRVLKTWNDSPAGAEYRLEHGTN